MITFIQLTDITKQTGTERKLEGLQERCKKWYNHVYRCLLNFYRGKHIFIAILEDQEVQEKIFSLAAGHGSVTELETEKVSVRDLFEKVDDGY